MARASSVQCPRVSAELETDKGRFWYDDRGFVQCEVLPDTDQSYELDDAKAFLAAIARVSGGARTPILADMRGVTSVSRPARLHLSSSAAAAVVTAVALVVESRVSKIIGNFFVTVNAPPFPTRLFVTVEQASAWILERVEGADREPEK